MADVISHRELQWEEVLPGVIQQQAWRSGLLRRANSGVSIGKKKLLPGDLVFYKKGYNGRYKNIYHVEIFVGYEWRNNQLVGYTMSSITGNYPSILKRDYTSRKGRVAQIARPAQ